jgi:hypothetical protein
MVTSPPSANTAMLPADAATLLFPSATFPAAEITAELCAAALKTASFFAVSVVASAVSSTLPAARIASEASQLISIPPPPCKLRARDEEAIFSPFALRNIDPVAVQNMSRNAWKAVVSDACTSTRTD